MRLQVVFGAHLVARQDLCQDVQDHLRYAARAVWDSAIVIAKYAEKWPDKFKGRRCLDLSAGCGLVGGAIRPLAGWVLQNKPEAFLTCR